MKYAVIKDCSYEQFERIRDAYYWEAPFALFEVGYSKKTKMAVFGFWDESYIVPQLQEFIRRIPRNKDLIAKVGDIIQEN